MKKKHLTDTTSFHDKNAQQIGIEGKFLSIIKAVYNQPPVNIILNDEKLKSFSLRPEKYRNGHSYISIQNSTRSPSHSN